MGLISSLLKPKTCLFANHSSNNACINDLPLSAIKGGGTWLKMKQNDNRFLVIDSWGTHSVVQKLMSRYF